MAGRGEGGEDALVLRWLASKLPPESANHIQRILADNNALQRVALPSGSSRGLTISDVSSSWDLPPDALQRALSVRPELSKWPSLPRSRQSPLPPARYLAARESGLLPSSCRTRSSSIVHSAAQRSLDILVKHRSHSLPCYNVACGGDAFFSGGGVLATGSDDGLVKIHRLSSAMLICTCTSHSGSPITDLECSASDRAALISGSLDGLLCCWSLNEGSIGFLSFSTRLSGAVTSISALKGHLFVVSSDDSLVRLVHAESGVLHSVSTRQPMQVCGRHTNVQQLHVTCTSAYGGLAAVACGQPLCSVELFKLNVGGTSLSHVCTLSETHTKPVTLVAFSEIATSLLAASENAVTMYTRSALEKHSFERMTSLALQGTGRGAAKVLMASFCCSDACVAVSTDKRQLQVFDARRGTLLRKCAPFESMCYVLHKHPLDSGLLVAASWDGRLSLIDARRAEIVKQVFESRSCNFALLDATFLPSGDVVCSDRDGCFSIVGHGCGPKELYRYTQPEQFVSLPEHMQNNSEIYSINVRQTPGAKLSDMHQLPFDEEYLEVFRRGNFLSAPNGSKFRRENIHNGCFSSKVFKTSVCPQKGGHTQPSLDVKRSRNDPHQSRSGRQEGQQPGNQRSSWIDHMVNQVSTRVAWAEGMSLQAQIAANDDGLDFDDDNDADFDITQEHGALEGVDECDDEDEEDERLWQGPDVERINREDGEGVDSENEERQSLASRRRLRRRRAGGQGIGDGATLLVDNDSRANVAANLPSRRSRRLEQRSRRSAARGSSAAREDHHLSVEYSETAVHTDGVLQDGGQRQARQRHGAGRQGQSEQRRSARRTQSARAQGDSHMREARVEFSEQLEEDLDEEADDILDDAAAGPEEADEDELDDWIPEDDEDSDEVLNSRRRWSGRRRLPQRSSRMVNANYENLLRTANRGRENPASERTDTDDGADAGANVDESPQQTDEGKRPEREASATDEHGAADELTLRASTRANTNDAAESSSRRTRNRRSRRARASKRKRGWEDDDYDFSGEEEELDGVRPKRSTRLSGCIRGKRATKRRTGNFARMEYVTDERDPKGEDDEEGEAVRAQVTLRGAGQKTRKQEEEEGEDCNAEIAMSEGSDAKESEEEQQGTRPRRSTRQQRRCKRDGGEYEEAEEESLPQRSLRVTLRARERVAG